MSLSADGMKHLASSRIISFAGRLHRLSYCTGHKSPKPLHTAAACKESNKIEQPTSVQADRYKAGACSDVTFAGAYVAGTQQQRLCQIPHYPCKARTPVHANVSLAVYTFKAPVEGMNFALYADLK